MFWRHNDAFAFLVDHHASTDFQNVFFFEILFRDFLFKLLLRRELMCKLYETCAVNHSMYE